MAMFGRWFGGRRREVWQRLAKEIGARYTPRTFLKHDRVDVLHGQWTITLDPFVVMAGKAVIPFTRLRAPFVETSGMRLRVHRTHLGSRIAAWLGFRDIEVGAQDFDDAFVVKSNDERKARELFADAALRDRLAGQKSLQLRIVDRERLRGRSFPPDADELCVMVSGHVEDLERLRRLIGLVRAVLDRLVTIGIARPERPDVVL